MRSAVTAAAVAGGQWRSLQPLLVSRSLASTAESILASLPNFEQLGVPAGAGSAASRDAFDLGTVHNLLKGLGSPQQRLSVVHIAGSKGKGSVTTMLSSILKASGYRVGSYTSPHITSLNERIAVDMQPISDEAFDALVARNEATLRATQQQPNARLSHFEALTCLALQHFAESQVDLAVIEVGLGGARDATNVFDANTLKLAVVTAIGLEHQKQLGDTLPEIAAAKAGILKQGRPVVLGRQPERAALDTLRAAAESNDCPVTHAHEAVTVEAGEVLLQDDSARQTFRIRSTAAQGLADPFEVSSRMVGGHQADNAATAVAAALELKHQGWADVSREALRAGLEAASMPGRFQVSRRSGQHPWLVLDGAHTPAAADSLSATLAAAFPGQRLVLVVAMADDKDHAGVLTALRKARPSVVVFTTVPIAGGAARSAPPGMLAANWQAASFSEARPLRCRELIKANMSAALEAARRELSAFPEGGAICVTGSLHAVAAAMKCPGWLPS